MSKTFDRDKFFPSALSPGTGEIYFPLAQSCVISSPYSDLYIGSLLDSTPKSFFSFCYGKVSPFFFLNPLFSPPPLRNIMDTISRDCHLTLLSRIWPLSQRSRSQTGRQLSFTHYLVFLVHPLALPLANMTFPPDGPQSFTSTIPASSP